MMCLCMVTRDDPDDGDSAITGMLCKLLASWCFHVDRTTRFRFYVCTSSEIIAGCNNVCRMFEYIQIFSENPITCIMHLQQQQKRHIIQNARPRCNEIGIHFKRQPVPNVNAATWRWADNCIAHIFTLEVWKLVSFANGLWRRVGRSFAAGLCGFARREFTKTDALPRRKSAYASSHTYLLWCMLRCVALSVCL